MILPEAIMTIYRLVVRNVYTLIHFGNFVAGSSDSAINPYIKLLPMAGAHQDFVNQRLNGYDTTTFQSPLLPHAPHTWVVLQLRIYRRTGWSCIYHRVLDEAEARFDLNLLLSHVRVPTNPFSM